MKINDINQHLAGISCQQRAHAMRFLRRSGNGVAAVSRLFVFFVAAIMLQSCVDFDSDATQAITVFVKLQLPDDASAASVEGKTITMSNALGEKYTAITNAEGIAQFNDLVPDAYSLSTSWSISSDEYAQITGDNVVTQGAVVGGTVNEQLLVNSNSAADPLTLQLQISVNRSLVISKIYFAQSKDRNNKNYANGEYIEIFNQSDDTINVSGLYIGLVESNSTPAYSLEKLHELYADSVVMLKQVFRIPTDENRLLAPGKALLLVNSAIDHTENSDLEHNLIGADYEAKNTNPKNKKIINNDDVKALDMIYTFSATLTTMNLLTGGPNGIVIFFSDLDVAACPYVYNYGKTTGSQWLVLPKRDIIDAVEVLKYTTNGIDLATKRMYDDLDAGYTNINSTTGRNGEMVVRKVSTRTGKDGHLILEDTNNSTNDFKIVSNIDLNLREYE